jgi:hypothetical protein
MPAAAAAAAAAAFPTTGILIWPQLLAQHRSMECVEDLADAESGEASAASAQSPPVARAPEPEEKAKRTKHTRVQKREKELYGLVTPVFLPLLDARDTAPKPEKKARPQTPAAPIAAIAEHSAPTGDAERREVRKSRREHADMEGIMAGESGQGVDVSKKPKRASTPTKKSALRQTTAAKPRRKRVSLVIDGQTVLPADMIIEPALASPSSEATSVSNSTASLDDMIDPRLTKPEPPVQIEHHDAVHHSLPRPMFSSTTLSPTKPLIDTPSTSFTSRTSEPIRSPTKTTPILPPPSRTPIDPTPVLIPDPLVEEPAGQPFNTYVGGLRGSGADDVDQAGSYGYPSSLGASYMESYMQSRPLRVRMEAADKAGLNGEEKRIMVEDRMGDTNQVENAVDEVEIRSGKGKERDDDEDDFMGEMEGF